MFSKKQLNELNKALCKFQAAHHKMLVDVNKVILPDGKILFDVDFATSTLVCAIYERLQPQALPATLFALGQLRQHDYKAALEFAAACGKAAIAGGAPYQAEYDTVLAELAKQP